MTFNTNSLQTALNSRLDLRASVYSDDSAMAILIQEIAGMGYNVLYNKDKYELKLISLFDNNELNVIDNVRIAIENLFKKYKNGLIFAIGQKEYDKLITPENISMIYRVVKFDDKTYYVKL